MRNPGYAKTASVLSGVLILGCITSSETHGEEVDASFRFTEIERIEHRLKQFRQEIKELSQPVVGITYEFAESESAYYNEFDWSFDNSDSEDSLNQLPVKKWNGIDGPRIDPIPAEQIQIFDKANGPDLGF